MNYTVNLNLSRDKSPAISADGFDLELEVNGLLSELKSVQEELLAVLNEKHKYLAVADVESMAPLQAKEQQLMERLNQCQLRREQILKLAQSQGTSVDSISQLANKLPSGRMGDLGKEVRESQTRMKLLQHQSLTNWVLAQRGLLHVSQMLEIIATGGRIQPTYGDKERLHARGGLLDDCA